MQPRHLVLVCHNLRPPTDPRGSCKARGAERVLERFKQLRKERDLAGLFRATHTGCLGGCESGCTVAVARTAAGGEPAGFTYYARVRAEDVDEIVARHLEGGEPVERLRAREEWLD